MFFVLDGKKHEIMKHNLCIIHTWENYRQFRWWFSRGILPKMALSQGKKLPRYRCHSLVRLIIALHGTTEFMDDPHLGIIIGLEI